MNELLLAISTFCSIHGNSPGCGYYDRSMEIKIKCQQEILKCLHDKKIEYFDMLNSNSKAQECFISYGVKK